MRRCDCSTAIQAIKLRLGYPTLKEDLAALKAVRERAGAGIDIMVDYNQALSAEEGLERVRALASEGIAWLEEPIRHDDLEGNARFQRRPTFHCSWARISTVSRRWTPRCGPRRAIW
jgi:L-alanine-DL-glutamate epimerase-like enolase superfamily enzyme